MKKIFTVMISMATAAAGAMAQNNHGVEPEDTLMSVRNAARVTLVHEASGVKVSVDGSAEDADSRSVYTVGTKGEVTMRSGQLAEHIPFVSRLCRYHESNWQAVIGGIGVGFVNAVGGEAGKYVEMGKSFEISVLNLIGASYSVPGCMADITIGFGLGWKNYRITTPDMRFAMDGQNVALQPYPADVTPKNSRIKVFSLGVPVYWEQRFPVNVMGGSRFSVALGAVLNYATHASLSAAWVDPSGKRVTDKVNDIGHRRFSADLLGIVRISCDVGVYVRYCPSTALSDRSAPQFRSFSTGLIIGY